MTFFDQELMAGERLKGKWQGKERLLCGFFGTGRLDDSGGSGSKSRI